MSRLYYKQGTVAETLVVDNMDDNFSNAEIGITFYSDAALTTVVDVGMTGTYGLKVTPAVNQYEQDIAGATAIDISVDTQLKAPTTISTAIKSIKATPSAITGATHWQMIVRAE